jgi:hypothetical protein
MNNLVRPKSVIPSHANEVATNGGVVITETRTAQFSESDGDARTCAVERPHNAV